LTGQLTAIREEKIIKFFTSIKKELITKFGKFFIMFMLLKTIIFLLRKILVTKKKKKKKMAFVEKDYLGLISYKIKSKSGVSKDFVNITDYEKYFDLLRNLGLEETFKLTTHDDLKIRGSYFHSPLINENNEKIIIFCHGITNDR